jgi:ABC-type branched-subunit amino acid transport system ATPase component
MSEAILDCKGVTRRFGGLVALDALDLQMPRGAILGLIGPNGSGKTTFFNVLTGIYGFSDGAAAFDGRDITGYSSQEVYRAGIARTFQRSRMCLPLSVFDNIMVGNHKRLDHGLWTNVFARKKLRKAFEEFYEEAHELVKIFDPPLAERMFEPVAGFPMIDRRRIEICRALISHPKLLLLDEPSAGMTHEETRQLMDDILEVRDRIKDLSIIIIEHEMGVIERITDRCIVLNFGRKIAEGTYQDVANDREVQEAYLGAE